MCILAQDPDFAPARADGASFRTAFPVWLFAFMRRYVTWRQWGRLAGAWALLRAVAGVPTPQLLLGWVAPSILRCASVF